MPIAPEYLHLVHPGIRFDAYLYGRASHDPTKRGRSVSTQLHEGRELCDRYGWPIVGVFDKDVDRSASRHRKGERADFEAMLDGIAARKCRIVVAWEASRYYRDLEAYVRLRNVCYEAGVLLCYNGTVYDLSKREDRKATAMDALQAEDEAEGIRDRNLRTQRRLAESGKPAGRPPWGYVRRYDPETGDLIDQVPHPTRKPYVIGMFKRFAAGESSYRIAQWLNSEPDAATRSGVRWDQKRVVEQLSQPAYAARRKHRGEIVGDAAWERIVDDDLFDAVQSILARPERRTQRDSRVRHLLAHIAYCGEHGDDLPKLIVHKGGSKPRYLCFLDGDTAISAPRFEAYVEQAIIEWLSSPAAVSAFQRDGEDAEAEAARLLAERLERQLSEARELAGTFDEETGEPRLSAMSLASMERNLLPKIKAAQEKSAALSLPVSPVVASLLGAPDVEAVWGGLQLEQKREVIRQVVTVRLHHAHVRGAQIIRPGRITMSFFGQPGFRGGSHLDRGSSLPRQGGAGTETV
ncbi:recombinase family protein [Streptomyces sp. NRRL S-337]|uniref:recombinase family protein n=1 Tax=Streptomyces sp. NRRL S-337 TaxID=1463900 RepID=UPI0004C87F3F|nr:recombinase family protein [Streptomyces sp. NRRL S-337]